MLQKTTQQSAAENTTPLPGGAGIYTAPALNRPDHDVKSRADESASEAEISALLRALAMEQAGMRQMQRARVGMIAIFVGLGAFVWLADAWITDEPRAHYTSHSFAPLMFIGPLVTVMSTMTVSVTAALKRRRSAMEKFARTTDRRAVGAMVDALGDKDIGTRTLASNVLLQILPRLRASDEALLLPAHRRILNDVLNRKRSEVSSVKLKCAILSAYEQIGDEPALPIVTDLANGPPNVPQTIRNSAIACLPALTRRVERVQGSRELLRGASSITETSSDVLVRPANSGTTEPADELLRAPTETDV